jgi:meso-butanediol dehydrogenase/(S,S)-butanediol dehydrogenase/diacetyl reductase
VRAIVTGAARGLGEGVAARLVRDGASVALIDVSPTVVETAARLQAQSSAAVSGLVADVADEAQVEAVLAEALTGLGGVDVLVSCAGIGGPGTPVTETSLAELRRTLDVNLVGAFLMARGVARVLVEQGEGGAIVNVGSMFGQRGVPFGAPYCMSKAGVALLTHSLALELAPDGITVNTVAPGNMATDMHFDELRDRAARGGRAFAEEVEAARREVPLARHGTGDDVAGAVAWLASADASYVTGQTISVNGGVLLT